MTGGGRANLQTLTALQPRLADGALSALALLADCLDAIAAHDGALHAVSRLNPQAQADALRLDAQRKRLERLGPLHGMPVVVKDNIDVGGLPTPSGCKAMAGAMPHGDAEAVRRLRAAGAVIVAKTHLSEFSFQIRSRSSLGGDVLNPFNPAVTAGGSSGGTAAAIAAGFAVAGLGSDTGGSIRTPAAYTGLTGLRPTHGLVDRRGLAPLAPTTDTVGPMARTALDVAALMSMLTDPPRAGAFAALSATSPRLAGARIGVLRQAFGADADIVAASEAALDAVREAGGTVIDGLSIPEAMLPAGRAHVVDWEFGLAFDAYLAEAFQPGSAPASLAEIHRTGAYLPDHREALIRRMAVRSLDAPAYAAILRYHHELGAALDALFDAHGLDALAYPTSKVTPDSLDNPKGGWAPELAACSGRPALSTPIGRAANGVPIGLELLGRRFGDAALLGLAIGLEDRLALRYAPDLG